VLVLFQSRLAKSVATIIWVMSLTFQFVGAAGAEDNPSPTLIGTWRNVDTLVTILITRDGAVFSRGGGLPGIMQRSIGGSGNFEIQGKRDDGSIVDCSYAISLSADKGSVWSLKNDEPTGACPRGGRFVQVDTSGRGQLEFPNGRRYLGDYRDGVPDGQGAMTFADGERDEGQWSDNKRVGRGVITWPDGARYEGEWSDAGRNGQGVQTSSNGQRYEGQWSNDKRDGRGITTTADGRRDVCEWRNGNCSTYHPH
jgi:hypothetical protein